PQAPNIAPQAPNIAPQAPNIAPQATFNDERPPNRGDERPRISPSSAEPPPPAHLKPGTTVGHKSGAYLGEIEKIYFSQKRRLWRGKIGAGYYDLDNLVEQKVIPWDSPKPIGNWVDTGTMTLRCEICTIWTRKQPQTQKPTENWTLAELAALPIWQVKDIAKRCCDFIPGGHPRTKRAYIRAILAEQELRAIAIEPAQIIVRKSEPAAKVQGLGSKPPKSKGRSKKDSLGPSEPLGQQLSLNLFLTAS
ncbi:MAG: hypothetical protein JGK40_19250, partial [Microcoleus sp. PH2017_21_RUC_O_A]|uniref:hypothetical protein n=1 Tax=Microcoleus sp. PH2017_21_RUC_O_A TaxID=2798832 RepID=UPI001DB2BEDE